MIVVKIFNNINEYIFLIYVSSFAFENATHKQYLKNKTILILGMVTDQVHNCHTVLLYITAIMKCYSQFMQLSTRKCEITMQMVLVGRSVIYFCTWFTEHLFRLYSE